MTHTLAPGGPASRQRGQAMAPGNAPSLGHLVSCFSSSPSIVLPGNTPLRSTYTNTSSIGSPLTSSGNLSHPLSCPLPPPTPPILGQTASVLTIKVQCSLPPISTGRSGRGGKVLTFLRSFPWAGAG